MTTDKDFNTPEEALAAIAWTVMNDVPDTARLTSVTIGQRWGTRRWYWEVVWSDSVGTAESQPRVLNRMAALVEAMTTAWAQLESIKGPDATS